MPKYRVHTTWEIRGWTDYLVEAESAEEASAKVENRRHDAEFEELDSGDSGKNEEVDATYQIANECL